jgi:hypothetical protein
VDQASIGVGAPMMAEESKRHDPAVPGAVIPRRLAAPLLK